MEVIPMFVIHPKNAADWAHAMFIMSYYHDLYCEMFSNGETAESAYMVVSDAAPGWDAPTDRAVENLRLAEMTFQGNWHQKGRHRCVHCSALPAPLQEETCGHLTFNRIIDSSAFDRAMGIS
jgi:hypothetical protein